MTRSWHTSSKYVLNMSFFFFLHWAKPVIIKHSCITKVVYPLRTDSNLALTVSLSKCRTQSWESCEKHRALPVKCMLQLLFRFHFSSKVLPAHQTTHSHHMGQLENNIFIKWHVSNTQLKWHGCGDWTRASLFPPLSVSHFRSAFLESVKGQLLLLEVG